MIIKACHRRAAILTALLIFAPLAAQTQGYDRTEAESCYGCHLPQDFVVETWLESSHANSLTDSTANTYCASCHSPFEADPAAGHGEDEREDISIDDAQAITCGVCHPPHNLRVEWGTPIGNYDIALDDWVPVYEEEANDLCTYCHSGSRHGVHIMDEMADVRCIDCHMPKMPVAREDGSIRMTRTHNFDFDPDDDVALAAKAAFSCGTDGQGCHGEHGTDWAMERIRSGVIHRVPPGGDTWEVQIPLLGEEFWITIEQFGDFLIVEKTNPDDGQTSISLGMEFDGIVFWLDVTGDIYFGNINRDAGTASGIVFTSGGGGSVWFAEQL